MTRSKHILTSAAVALALLGVRMAVADTFTEDFTGTTTTNKWYFSNGACLTASTAAASGSPGQPPGCTSIASTYYKESLVGGQYGTITAAKPDDSGSGALRFTNGKPGGYSQAGAIVSADTFPAGQGIQITFKTVTYRGDSGGAGGDGADGIGFFLMDGSYAISSDGAATSEGLGAIGGSLGYTCSNVNNTSFDTSGGDGLVGAYIGLGIDEYGNFLNGSKLMSGYTGGNSATGDNSALGYGYKPNRIGLRGTGNVAWGWLNATYPLLYPSSLTLTQKQNAVHYTCRDGVLWDYSNAASPKATTTAVADYAPIPNAYKELGTSVLIAKESAVTRGDATPIFYNLKITQDGLLSLSYSINGGAYTSVIKNQDISASNGTMPTSFRFGFAGSTGGSTNIHELMCFKATPANTSASSANANEKQAAKVEAGTQAYFAFYNPNNWTGRLTANSLIDTAGVVTVATLANWDASCVLTGLGSGETCTTTGTTGPTSAQGSSNRVMLTWDSASTKGIPFQWTSLNSTQQSTLNAGDSYGQNRLNYLRGDTTNEVPTSGPSGTKVFRSRDGILGDIVDSSPVWSGPPSSPYTGTWVDRINAAATIPESSATQNYAAFTTARQTRQNLVFAGTNDGFLHGVRAGSFDASGAYVDNSTTPNDGKEVLAFMPNTILNAIHNTSDSSLDFSSPQYSHNFYVDATPGTGDLYYGGTWHTWLVGGLGVGGNALFALDVTDTSATALSESNASNIVVGEWSNTTISCAIVTSCGSNLGNTFGTPVIRRLHNGKWAVLFGNGYNSSSGDAGLFIMTVDPTTAVKTFYYLSTGKSGTSDGIAYVTPADLDGDHITDYVYAGDLLGNVWRFDLTDSNPANWAAGSAPLFTASSGQPITTRVLAIAALNSAVSSTQPMLMIEFGTGQRNQLTNLSPATYTSGTQNLYGIWDWNMSSWNGKSTTKFSSLAATNAATGLSSPYTITCSSSTSCTNLTQQTFTITSSGTRTGTNNTVCWRGVTITGCSTSTSFGWYVNLPGSAEQIVFNPVYYQGAFIVDSTVPATNTPTSCKVIADSGFTYAISVTSGGTFASPFPNYTDTNLVGVETDATGSPYIVTTVEGKTNLVYQTVPGVPNATQINLPTNTKAKRLTWVELR